MSERSLAFWVNGHSSLTPIIKNPNAASIFKILLGIIEAIDPPANTPNKLASTRALAEPKNTANGWLLVPLKVIVANCVLSPSSARNIVMKVVSKSASIIT